MSVRADCFSSRILGDTLDRLSPNHDYLIAYSGGMDSHVLLHAIASLSTTKHLKVSAIHIDHGLLPESRNWTEHCQLVCQSLGVPMVAVKIDAGPIKGQSPEATARTARYTALSDQTRSGQVLLTAHHLDDQVETFFLQLIRGGGMRGLSAMPAVQNFGTGYLLRPLLEFSRSSLEEYARQHALEWIEDSSNRDTGYDRNYLRHVIMPLIYERWPSARRTISRVAKFSAETISLAEVLGRQDMVQARSTADSTLSIQRLNMLSPERRNNLLRTWIRNQGYRVPSANILNRISTDVVGAASDRMPVLSWDQAEIRRYRNRLFLMPPLPAATPRSILPWKSENVALPIGTLCYYEVPGAGLRATLLQEKEAEVRFRQGGEIIRPSRSSHQRSLKKLLQESAVPPWLREFIPLIYVNDQLVAVPGICVAHDYAATGKEAGIEPYWQLPPEFVESMMCSKFHGASTNET